MPKIFMPLGDATEAMDTFYPYYRLQEDGYEVVVAGPEARLYHTVLHEIPPDSNVPWDITQERPGYFIKATLAFRDAKGADFAGAFVSGGRAPEYIRYNQDLLRVMREIHASRQADRLRLPRHRDSDRGRHHRRQDGDDGPQVQARRGARRRELRRSSKSCSTATSSRRGTGWTTRT